MVSKTRQEQIEVEIQEANALIKSLVLKGYEDDSVMYILITAVQRACGLIDIDVIAYLDAITEKLRSQEQAAVVRVHQKKGLN